MRLFRRSRKHDVTTPATPTAAASPAAGVARPAVANPRVEMPLRIFIVALLWIVLLVAAFFVWVNVAGFREFFPATLGTLPVPTIWFGAVGGLLISLEGIYYYNRNWLRSYDYWHYTRPILGAFIGVLGCLVFVVLTNAATTNAATTLKPDAVFYDVLALVIGYREQSFRELITRLTDTILLPKNAASSGTANEPPPATGGTAPRGGG